jgi:parvulin-like peptidyl-prolyl isomerase
MYFRNILNKKIVAVLIFGLSINLFSNELKNKVYAVVNGENITSQSIAIALKDPRIQFETLPKDTKKNILQRIIEQKILSQYAVKTDVIKSSIYIKTLNGLKQDLALQVWLQEESKKIKVTNKEMKDYYNANIMKFKVSQQYHARHILVATKKEAIEIIKTLNKSKSNLKYKFISIAKKKSTGPSGANGGDLGFFTSDKMVPEFSTAVSRMKVGTISKKPIKTQFGFHVIYLEDKKKASSVSFKKAKNQIKQQLGQIKIMKHIQQLASKLRKKAKIQYK